LGQVEIHTYGALVAAGFLGGLWLAQSRARRAGLAPEIVSELGLWIIVAAMLGAKLFYLIFFWPEFAASWRASGPAALRAGFVFYGGFLGAVLWVLGYARVKQLPLWPLADSFAPALPLGHALGRLGCFFEGCCYGKTCPAPWGVTFPGHAAAVHPTQLYEAAGNLVLLAGLLALDRRRRPAGQLWWLYVLGYAGLRFTIEFFRGDYSRYYWGGLTLGHWIAGGLAVVAGLGLSLCKSLPSPPR
jgi:phosphatidylglycerol:prolipoprotein diacylglycerol transferase